MRVIRYFSFCGLIVCFLISTIGRFPPNISPWFISVVRSNQFELLAWITPILAIFFLVLFCYSLKNIFKHKTNKLIQLMPLIIGIALIVAYNLLNNLWQDKIIMSWLWRKDLNTIVELAQQHKLKITGKYNHAEVAVLPNELRYISFVVYINLYKAHENEMTISFVTIRNYLSSYSFYYSSLDLPPTAKNKKHLFGNDEWTVVGTVRKVMPHWYVLEEWYDYDESFADHYNGPTKVN